MQDFFERPESKKEMRQGISRENRRKGKVGEEFVKMRYELHGYEVERTGKGSDFHVRKRDILGRAIDSKYLEVKMGYSHRWPLHEETKKRKRGHFKEEREYVPPFFYKGL